MGRGSDGRTISHSTAVERSLSPQSSDLPEHFRNSDAHECVRPLLLDRSPILSREPIRVFLVLLGDAVGPLQHVMDHSGCSCECNNSHTGILAHAFPSLDQRADPRVIGKARVKRWLVGMVQHVHYVCTAHPRGIVKTRLVEAPRL